MSTTTSIPKTAGRQRSHLLNAITVTAVMIALAALAVATYALGYDSRSVRSTAPTQASVLRELTPAGRDYVLGITAMTPVEVSASFGTSPTSVEGRHRGGASTGAGTPTLDSVLRSLTPRERRYVLGIASLTLLQLWGAFGTTPTPPVPNRGTRSATASSATTSR